MRDFSVKGVRADGQGGRIYHKFIKVQKRRTERRKAKRNPECLPAYGRYVDYET